MDRSELLLDLYRAARELPTGAFEEAAVVLLKGLIGFDSAVWGSGQIASSGAITPHWVHRHLQPEESVQAWADINVSDPVGQACLARPGLPLTFHAPTLFAAPAATAMRDYALRFERQSYMVCALQHPQHDDFICWLSLYRRNSDAHFSDREREFYRLTIAHLHEAQRINRQLHGRSRHEQGGCGVLAIADVHGYLHTPDSEVDSLLRSEWNHRLPGRLPDPLLQTLLSRPGTAYRGHSIGVDGQWAAGLLFLRLWKRTAFDSLSLREQQVVDAIARGLSAKQTAKALGLSPATVRVHLQHVYGKLDVHSQAELAYLVGVRDRGLEPAP